jgi:cobalt/nickel transport protein
MQKLVGYIPKGLNKLSRLWNAPLPDYALKGWKEKGLTHLSFAYIFSAILGIAIIVIVIFVIGKVLIKRRD